jgi:UDP-N-acetylmuramyl tripeptide synthase
LKLHDSRRLPGPNLAWVRPGVVIDIALEAGDSDASVDAAIAAWERHARDLLAALGWPEEQTLALRFPGGFSLHLSAPIDALYAATEVNEAAWAAAVRAPDDPAEPLDAPISHLRALIDEESNPALLALAASAAAHGLAFVSDDDLATVGLGAGSRTWPVDALPSLETSSVGQLGAAIDWPALHDIPVALVTGTNGKSTTVRLLGAMARAAGLCAGLATTDWIRVGDETLDEGDWSGPGGARAVLRDGRVQMALLETARGGMQRRGLAVARAAVAAITNVAPDHLGDFGLVDLDMLADLKFVVARAAEHLVLNAEDPMSVARVDRIWPIERGKSDPTKLTWFSLDPSLPMLEIHRAQGGRTVTLELDWIILREGDAAERVLPIAEVSITLGGAARHNLANSLTAVALAQALGLPLAAIRAGLRDFGRRPEDNPGRLNRFNIGGIDVLVDFAHNPHGVEAVVETALHMPAARRLVLLGQAGDRDDEAIRGLATAAWRLAPDLVILKELPKQLRGRAVGEVPALLAGELLRLGARPEQIEVIEGELEAVRRALEWGRPGDQLLLLVHARRRAVMALVEALAEADWQPGDDLPAS